MGSNALHKDRAPLNYCLSGFPALLLAIIYQAQVDCRAMIRCGKIVDGQSIPGKRGKCQWGYPNEVLHFLRSKWPMELQNLAGYNYDTRAILRRAGI